MLNIKDGSQMDTKFKTASTKIRKIAKQAAKRNIASKVVSETLKKGTAIDPFTA